MINCEHAQPTKKTGSNESPIFLTLSRERGGNGWLGGGGKRAKVTFAFSFLLVGVSSILLPPLFLLLLFLSSLPKEENDVRDGISVPSVFYF